MTKLWLDDVRPAPDDSWTWAKTIEEAQEILLTGEVTVASLDHDLGAVADPNWDGDPCEPQEIPLEAYYSRASKPGGDGIDLIIWMVEEQCFPTESIIIHSWNPAGAENMFFGLKAGGCKVPVELKPFEIPEDLLY